MFFRVKPDGKARHSSRTGAVLMVGEAGLRAGVLFYSEVSKTGGTSAPSPNNSDISTWTVDISKIVA